MAAGLGFKTFTTGEVLTAADTNGYLMQGINVFASTAARDAAITSPQEGQFAFTKDTNGLWYYDGAAWVASGATGDIEGVTAGIGISGGGTSGTVTVTNSMATAIDAKGDLVVGTAADTFSRLAVGADGTTIVADSAEATGLKWATPASGSTYAGALAYSNANQSIANATNTAILLQAESFDTDAFHSTSSNTSRMTIPTGKGGKYLIQGALLWQNGTSGERALMFYKNGSQIAKWDVTPGSATTWSFACSIVADLVATDYVELFCTQSSGGAVNVYGSNVGNGTSTFLSVSLLGA